MSGRDAACSSRRRGGDRRRRALARSRAARTPPRRSTTASTTIAAGAALPGLPEPVRRRLAVAPRGRDARRDRGAAASRRGPTDEVRAFFVERYGEWVLLEPPSAGRSTCSPWLRSRCVGLRGRRVGDRGVAVRPPPTARRRRSRREPASLAAAAPSRRSPLLAAAGVARRVPAPRSRSRSNRRPTRSRTGVIALRALARGPRGRHARRARSRSRTTSGSATTTGHRLAARRRTPIATRRDADGRRRRPSRRPARPGAGPPVGGRGPACRRGRSRSSRLDCSRARTSTPPASRPVAAGERPVRVLRASGCAMHPDDLAARLDLAHRYLDAERVDEALERVRRRARARPRRRRGARARRPDPVRRATGRAEALDSVDRGARDGARVPGGAAAIRGVILLRGLDRPEEAIDAFEAYLEAAPFGAERDTASDLITEAEAELEA